MISVGIDVAKGKSTISVITRYGEILLSPKDYKHTIDDLNSFNQKLSKYNEEIRITMEATGTYHLPVYRYFKDKGYFVNIINPLEMKRYRCLGIRNPKTDRIDSLIIAQYGIDYWYRAKPQNDRSEIRQELKLLGKKAFQQCKSLGYLNLSGKIEKIAEGSFIYCQALQSVSFTTETLKEICEDAFGQCKKLETIQIPKTVKSIHGKAFSGCNRINLK